MKRTFSALILSVVLCSPGSTQAPSSVEVFYAPTDNLEHQDVTLIRSARKTIDIAAFTFSSFAVIDALAEAGRRGVRVRVLLDPSQLRQRQETALSRIEDLSRIPGVTIRVKVGRDYMHLKSYIVDGTVLRSGSANFSPSGLKRQNNDLIVIRNPKASARFEEEFMKTFGPARVYP